MIAGLVFLGFWVGLLLFVVASLVRRASGGGPSRGPGGRRTSWDHGSSFGHDASNSLLLHSTASAESGALHHHAHDSATHSHSVHDCSCDHSSASDGGCCDNGGSCCDGGGGSCSCD